MSIIELFAILLLQVMALNMAAAIVQCWAPLLVAMGLPFGMKLLAKFSLQELVQMFVELGWSEVGMLCLVLLGVVAVKVSCSSYTSNRRVTSAISFTSAVPSVKVFLQ